MSKAIQSIRGMRDILPEQSYQWQQFEQVVVSLMQRYGYEFFCSDLLLVL